MKKNQKANLHGFRCQIYRPEFEERSLKTNTLLTAVENSIGNIGFMDFSNLENALKFTKMIASSSNPPYYL